MTSPLKDTDHDILRKLCDQVLIWMIGSRFMQRQWFVRLAIAYRYGGDLAAALAGLGFGGQLARVIGGKASEGGNVALDALSGPWFWGGTVALVAWVFLRLYAQNENIIARALLAREHVHSMRALYAELWAALDDPEPMPQVVAIQRTVNIKVRDAIRNGIWPWDPPPPPLLVIGTALAVEVERIRATHMRQWAPPDQGGLKDGRTETDRTLRHDARRQTEIR